MEFRLLKADEIECRIASVKTNGLSLLLYKDARVDQNILDETVGKMNWQRKHEVINGNLFCSVGIFCERIDDPSEWIWKQDVGVESYTEKEKGQASDAFKRACFNWGIGRELYTAPFIWISAGNYNVKDGKCYDKFKVKTIAYKDHKITELTIINESMKGKVIYKMGEKIEETPEITPEEISKMKISKIKLDIIRKDIENGVFNEEELLKWFKVEKLEDVTEGKFASYVKKKGDKK